MDDPLFRRLGLRRPAGLRQRSSPITFIKNVKTPTLILVGDRDGECPAPQSFEFWHALRTSAWKPNLSFTRTKGTDLAAGTPAGRSRAHGNGSTDT